MFKKILSFLHSINPIVIYREEKRLDREAMVFMVSEVCSAMKQNSDVMLQHGRIIETFINNFAVHEPNEASVVREEDEVTSFLERNGIKKEDISIFD